MGGDALWGEPPGSLVLLAQYHPRMVRRSAKHERLVRYAELKTPTLVRLFSCALVEPITMVGEQRSRRGSRTGAGVRYPPLRGADFINTRRSHRGRPSCRANRRQAVFLPVIIAPGVVLSVRIAVPIVVAPVGGQINVTT
jgi:hypothetical protein